MTCIVGIQHEGVVHMGADSHSGSMEAVLQHLRSDKKVFVHHGMVIGFTSSWRMGQILRYSFVPPKHPEKMDDMEYLVTRWVDALRKKFNSTDFIKPDDPTSFKGEFLLGYKKKLYYVHDDYQIGCPLPVEGDVPYASVGCGSDVALGSLYATKSFGMHPQDRMLLALKAANHFAMGVRPPYNFVCYP